MLKVDAASAVGGVRRSRIRFGKILTWWICPAKAHLMNLSCGISLNGFALHDLVLVLVFILVQVLVLVVVFVFITIIYVFAFLFV